MSDSDDEAHNCNVCGTPVRYGSRHSECGASVMRAEKAALRPRNPEMDAIVKGIHGSPAFTLENASKAVSAAMAKHCRRCGMQGRDIGSDGVQRCTYCGIAHPDIDMVAYGQRIMDLVDQYHETPNQQTRYAIRAAIMDGLTPLP